MNVATPDPLALAEDLAIIAARKRQPPPGLPPFRFAGQPVGTHPRWSDPVSQAIDRGEPQPLEATRLRAVHWRTVGRLARVARVATRTRQAVAVYRHGRIYPSIRDAAWLTGWTYEAVRRWSMEEKHGWHRLPKRERRGAMALFRAEDDRESVRGPERVERAAKGQRKGAA